MIKIDFKTILSNTIYFTFQISIILGILSIPFRHYFIYKWAIQKSKDKKNIHSAQLCRISKFHNRKGYFVSIQGNNYLTDNIMLPSYMKNNFPISNKERLFFQNLKNYNTCVQTKFVLVYYFNFKHIEIKKFFLYDFN